MTKLEELIFVSERSNRIQEGNKAYLAKDIKSAGGCDIWPRYLEVIVAKSNPGHAEIYHEDCGRMCGVFWQDLIEKIND